MFLQTRYTMDKQQKIHIYKDEDEISAFLVDQWKEISGEATRTRGYFAAALSGGRTPVGFYQRLARIQHALTWDKTQIFLVDERFVPFDDPDSNYRMIRETLLDKIQIPRENVHPIPAESPDPRSSAENYERELARFFKLSPGQAPQFDLVLLGIGEDGHTASLFPGSPALDEERLLATAVILDPSLDN